MSPTAQDLVQSLCARGARFGLILLTVGGCAAPPSSMSGRSEVLCPIVAENPRAVLTETGYRVIFQPGEVVRRADGTLLATVSSGVATRTAEGATEVVSDSLLAVEIGDNFARMIFSPRGLPGVLRGARAAGQGSGWEFLFLVGDSMGSTERVVSARWNGEQWSQPELVLSPPGVQLRFDHSSSLLAADGHLTWFVATREVGLLGDVLQVRRSDGQWRTRRVSGQSATYLTAVPDSGYGYWLAIVRTDSATGPARNALFLSHIGPEEVSEVPIAERGDSPVHRPQITTSPEGVELFWLVAPGGNVGSTMVLRSAFMRDSVPVAVSDLAMARSYVAATGLVVAEHDGSLSIIDPANPLGTDVSRAWGEVVGAVRGAAIPGGLVVVANVLAGDEPSTGVIRFIRRCR